MSLEDLLNKHRDYIESVDEPLADGNYDVQVTRLEYDENKQQMKWDLNIKGTPRIMTFNHNIAHEVGGKIFVQTLKDLGCYDVKKSFADMIKTVVGLEFNAFIKSKQVAAQGCKTMATFYNFYVSKEYKNSTKSAPVSKTPPSASEDLPF